MTSKKTARTSNKTRRTGVVNVGTDGNMLRLQFPSNVSKTLWGTKQKYKALGLFNTPENMAKAQEIASIAQMDLLRDEFDVSLEKYNPFLLQKAIEEVEPNFPGLLELCKKHFEAKIRPNISQSTLYNYKTYFRAIEKSSCADTIKDAIKIKDSIREIRSVYKTRRILAFIYNTVQWAKRNELIPKNVENPYKDLAQDIVGKAKYQKPKHIQELLGEDDGGDHKAYSASEAKAIIEQFSFHKASKGVYKDFVEFLFLTGCRTSEAIGLRWEDISNDCSEIIFRHSYCTVSKELKGLKTENSGKTSRKFPCGEKLKQLLLKVRNSQAEVISSKSFVFSQKKKVVNYRSFYRAWTGGTGRSDGIIEHLIKQGNVVSYLKPYATRHSFITWQLKAGQTPANVAKLVGNTPEMIYKHYVSADEDAKVMFEV